MSNGKSNFSYRSFLTFGDLLKFLRRRARLTQRELSIAVNYSEAHISRLERNLRQPDLAALTALFFPALNIDNDPEIVARLLELAAQARDEERPVNGNVAFVQSLTKETVKDASNVEEHRNTNLPIQLTTFFGRDHEIAEIKGLLNGSQDPVRLVTLTGGGGSGKTRLALEIGGQLANSYPDGVWLIELAPTSNRSNVEHKFIFSLGLPEPREVSPTAALIKHLQNRHLLLIVDSCEHVIPTTAVLLHEILKSCPRVQILATSREIMKIAGEVRYNLPPLITGNDVDSDAVKLFVDRAKLTLPTFELTEDNTSSVFEICRRLDGIPLAIELAAARVSLLTIQQIASYLESNFQLLAGGSALVERHQTMEATIDWSYKLLSEAQSILLKRLSIFSGDWALDAATAVASDQTLIPEDSILELLSQLVNKSLVMVRWESKSPPRYHMLQTVSQFARKKLQAPGELNDLYEQHFKYFLSLAETAKDHWDSEQERIWLKKLEEERDNLYTALIWAIDHGKTEYALRLNSALVTFWIYNSPAGEAVDWLERSLSMAWDKNSPSVLNARAEALNVAGYAALHVSDTELATTRFKEGGELFSKLGNQMYLAWSLRGRGFACLIRGDLDEAQIFLEKSLDISREIGHDGSLAWTVFELGNVALAQNELVKAEKLLGDALSLFRLKGREQGEYRALISMGHLMRVLGKRDESVAFYRESLIIQRETKYIQFVAQILEGMAFINIADKNTEIGVQLFGSAQARHDLYEMARWHHHEVEFQKSLQMTKKLLDAVVWQRAWDQGYNMDPQTAQDIILAD